jgi:hypothetical protein
MALFSNLVVSWRQRWFGKFHSVTLSPDAIPQMALPWYDYFMSWKNFRNWLNGGLISSVLILVSLLVVYLVDNSCAGFSHTMCIAPSALIILLPVLSLIESVPYFISQFPYYATITLSVLLWLLLFFVLGGVAGYMFEWRKRRRNFRTNISHLH